MKFLIYIFAVKFDEIFKRTKMKNLGKVKILAFAVLLAFGAVNARANPDGEGGECGVVRGFNAKECADFIKSAVYGYSCQTMLQKRQV